MEELVFTSSLSILVNRSLTKDFEVSRGLHQGDPLSPFLFLLVAEVLVTIMKKEISIGEFDGFHLNNKVHFGFFNLRMIPC